MSFRNYKIELTIKSWKRDSYGLFDYDTTEIYAQTITATRPGILTRSTHRLSYTNFSNEKKKAKQLTTGDETEENLLYIGESSEGLEILPEGLHLIPEEFSIEDSAQFWEVVENTETNRGRILKPQDVVKFGRIMLRISQIKIGNEDRTPYKGLRRSFVKSIPDHTAFSKRFRYENLLEEENEKKGKCSNAGNLCKICLSEKSEFDEEEDPLISPCKCIGSVKFVHLKCMQNWVKSKLDIQHDRNVITILWKNMSCELCKHKLPVTIEHNGETLSLVPFDNKLKGSYMILESFSKEMDSTGVHFVDFSSEKSIKVGRGRDSDLKINDISVSRIHAAFTIHSGNLYVKDNNSKFGTLIWQKHPIVLNPDRMRTGLIQCGRTVLKFTLKKPWIAYIPCIGFCFSFTSRPRESRQCLMSSSTAKMKNRNDETRARLGEEEEGLRNSQTNWNE